MASRYPFLDAARGLLMILGIVYHAARVYGETPWLVSDPASQAFDVLAATLRSFRMPAFFLMSGFFAALTLGLHGPGPFLRTRAPRILLPFLTALLTLNVAQLYVIEWQRGTAAGALEAIVSGSLWSGVPIDEWVSHLWFLVCLACYFPAAAVGAALLGAGGARRLSAIGRATRLAGRPATCLLLLPLGNLAVLALFWRFPALYGVRPLVTLDTIAGYLPFFAVGTIVFASPRFYESMTRYTPGGLAVTAAAGAIALLSPGTSGLMGRVVDAYGGFLWSWVAVYWVLVGFRAALDRPNPVAATLADASYTIYLFHHLTVILIGWWLADTGLGAAVKFPLLIALTLALTLAIHRVIIRKVPPLMLLFNGRRTARHTPTLIRRQADGDAAASSSFQAPQAGRRRRTTMR